MLIERKINVCQLIQKSTVLDCIDTMSIKSFLYVSVRPLLYFYNRGGKIRHRVRSHKLQIDAFCDLGGQRRRRGGGGLFSFMRSFRDRGERRVLLLKRMLYLSSWTFDNINCGKSHSAKLTLEGDTRL